MKTAICAFCAQTGMLCNDCQTKLNNGEISETDIIISKVAIEFEKKHSATANVTILKTIENPEFIILLVAPGNLRFLVGGVLDFDKRLENALKKPIKILEKSKNKRKAIDDIFSPALVSGINTVFVPVRNPKPGQSSIEEETIVLLSPEEKSKLPGKMNDLIELVKLIAGIDIRVEFR